jgi:glyoxylase-like metal-dependent hydrolase (beta-lactamase superfamily II)
MLGMFRLCFRILLNDFGILWNGMHVIKLENSPYDANAYLVEGKILVDAGMDAAYVISELEKHISLNSLETIILTHCHYDHSGAAGEVAQACGARMAIHQDDAPLLGDSNACASSMFGEKAPSVKPDILLKGGEMFGGLRVIHTPGHTPGGICLYESSSKILFSGDTVFPNGGFGRTDLFGGNTAQLIESIRKLSSLDVSVMYPGHGEVVTGNASDHIRMALVMAGQYGGL